jgi:hypothetical protein
MGSLKEVHPFLMDIEIKETQHTCTFSKIKMLSKDAGKETTVLHFSFSIRRRGNVCCQCENIYNMFVLHTTGEQI